MALTEEIRRKFEEIHGISLDDLSQNPDLAQALNPRVSNCKCTCCSYKKEIDPVEAADKRNMEILKDW